MYIFCIDVQTCLVCPFGNLQVQRLLFSHHDIAAYHTGVTSLYCFPYDSQTEIAISELASLYKPYFINPTYQIFRQHSSFPKTYRHGEGVPKANISNEVTASAGGDTIKKSLEFPIITIIPTQETSSQKVKAVLGKECCHCSFSKSLAT